MRISISGSHSTGKTTLVERCFGALVARYPSQVGIIREVARDVIANGFPLNQDATCDSYVNYIMAQLVAERHAIEPNVLSDRSLVDLLAYIRANSDGRVPDYFVKMIEEILYIESSYFDLYCYLPIEYPLVMDDVRPSEEDYRAVVDAELIRVLDDYHLPYETICGDVEERVAKIISLFR